MLLYIPSEDFLSACMGEYIHSVKGLLHLDGVLLQGNFDKSGPVDVAIVGKCAACVNLLFDMH